MNYNDLPLRKKRELESEVSEKLNISSKGSRRLMEEKGDMELHGTNRQRITKNDYSELDEERKKNKNFYR